jgi:NADH:ubiquinone oxidoreductase subunit E
MSIYTADQLAQFRQDIQEFKDRPDGLIPAIHVAQDSFRCVPVEAQKIIAEVMDVSVARISGIVTFYDYFTMHPLGKHVVEVCLGTSCYMQDAKDLLALSSEILGVQPHETREDGHVSLRIGRCFGRCEHSPNVEIDHHIHKHISADELRQHLATLEADK